MKEKVGKNNGGNFKIGVWISRLKMRRKKMWGVGIKKVEREDG